MTDSPFPSAEVRRLASELSKMRARIALLEGGQATSGMGLSSIDGGTLVVKDATGTVRQVQGTQIDGRVTTVDVNGPVPPAPVPPVLEPVPGGLKVSYSGAFDGGVARPTDLALIEVHVDQDPAFTVSDSTLDAALSGRGSVTFATTDYVPHTVRLVARSTSGVRSAPSGSLTATPAQLGPGDIAPGGVGTVQLDDGAVTPPKAGTGVTSNLVPDPGFNDAGWRAKRTAAPWGFVDAGSVGFIGGDWAAYCGPTTTRAVLAVTGSGGVPVSPGEAYFIAYDAGRSASAAGRTWCEVTFYDAAGQLHVAATEDEVDPLLAEVRAISSLPSGTFETRHGQVTVPPGVATMRVAMVRHDEAGTSSGQLYLDRLEVRSVVTRASTGNRVETSPSGILVFDATGNPVGSINANGSITMATGQFDTSLTYGGTEVGDLLDQRARGEVARVDAGPGATPATTSQVVWLEFEFNAVRGRAYKLRSSGLIGRGTSQGIRARYTVDGTRPLGTSPILAYTAVGQTQTLYLASDIGGLADSGDVRVRLNLCVVSWDGANAFFDPSDLALGFSAWVEDVGPRQAASGGIVTGGSTGGSGSGGSTTPTTTVKTFVGKWNCTWSQSWVVGNKVRGDASTQHRMWQGYISSADAYGDQAAIFGFNMTDVRAALAGATIKKLEIYLYAQHWYFNAGGEVWLGTTPVSNPPGNYPATTTQRAHWRLNKPEGKWVDIGAVGITIGNEIKAGTTGSFLLDPRPFARNLNDYGYFTGYTGVNGDSSPGLRITYEKAVAN